MVSPMRLGMFGRGFDQDVPWRTPPINGSPPHQEPGWPTPALSGLPQYAGPASGPGPVNGSPAPSLMPSADAASPMTGNDLANLARPSFQPGDLHVRKPGFFDRDGLGVQLAGALGDGLLQLNGMAPTFAPMMEQRRQQQRAEQQYQRRRNDENDDWLRREQWKIAHPDDQFTQYLTAAGIDPRSSQGQAMYRQRAETMATPPTVAVDGFDAQGNPTKTFMPRAGLTTPGTMPATSGPPVGTVKNGFRFVGGNPNDRASWAPVGGASSGGGATFPAAMNAVVGQESGGRAGAIGPMTRYGQAQGLAQLLPATAKAMAGKLGIAWRPELMTATAPEAAAYQRRLGEAYLQEGIAATGNLHDGLRYYHGGPSRRMWGPKTNAYVDAVLARMGAR